MAGATPSTERVEGDKHANDGSSASEQLTAVGFGATAKQLKEHVGGELCGRAGIHVESV
jgi:hypothetical protein